ncbi:hypothetical protein OG982_27005 [Streptomyces sp. NBC_01551]|uniref:hypothetical protein n=1 Tax=Streptomyces sp. NBC_01551 TaxID=2975876 RepID=UPI002258C457|nr:hypothetical protein [Streptomyces sp. NBC_01551]MCX4529301.1 hypothetical protein [Streptomyces sp. NBC_01551]
MSEPSTWRRPSMVPRILRWPAHELDAVAMEAHKKVTTFNALLAEWVRSADLERPAVQKVLAEMPALSSDLESRTVYWEVDTEHHLAVLAKELRASADRVLRACAYMKFDHLEQRPHGGLHLAQGHEPPSPDRLHCDA